MPDGPGDDRIRVDLENVRIFAVVARTKSLQAAARALGIQPVTVGRRLVELEHSLHAQLTVRGPNGVTLTEAGERALEQAQAIFRLGEAFERATFNKDLKPEGRVTIAAPDLFSSYCIAPHAGEFFDAHPKIRLILDCGFWAKSPPPDHPDVALTFDQDVAQEAEVSKHIATVHYCFFASRRYLAAHGPITRLSDIPDHRVSHNLAHSFQEERWGPRFTALRGLVLSQFITNSGATSVQSIEGGAGIGLLPTYVARHHANLEVVLDEPAMALKLWLTHKLDAHKTARVGHVIKWLTKVVNRDDQPWFRDVFVHPKHFPPTDPFPSAATAETAPASDAHRAKR